jgi:hypothetical protein
MRGGEVRPPEKATPGGNRADAEAQTRTGIVVEASCLDKRTRHPMSQAFGDMPEADFDELVADIKRNGLLTTITTAEDGSILDGWHRYLACLEAGVKPRFEPFKFVIEPAAEAAGRSMTEAEFVCSQNAHRRHLTAAQKHDLIMLLLKADSTQSDRSIAKKAKVSDKTVGSVRAKAEAVAEIPQQKTRRTSDGKVRKLPTKPPTVPTTGPLKVPTNRGRVRLPKKTCDAIASCRGDLSALVYALRRTDEVKHGRIVQVHKNLQSLVKMLGEIGGAS